jgi:hypothetical protein
MFGGYVYIPYTTRGVLGEKVQYLTLRKPRDAAEWLFVICFVSLIGAILYRYNRASNSQLKAEAKRDLLIAYRKYMRIGLFCVLFPVAANNKADEIVQFCTHVAQYYRTVATLSDLFGDGADVVTSIFDVMPTFPSTDLSQQSHGNECVHIGCGVTATTPCDTVCSGASCTHSDVCIPERDELKQQSGKFWPWSRGERSPVDVAEEAARRQEEQPKNAGLGYDYHRTSGIFRRLKNRFTNFFQSTLHSCYLWMNSHQWFTVGASLVTIAVIAAAAGKFYQLRKEVHSTHQEGGKKRNRGGKKLRSDMKDARDHIKNRTEVTHAVSGGSVLAYGEEIRRRKQDEKDFEDYQTMVWGESKTPDGNKYDSLNRDALVKELKRVRATWFAKDQVENIKDRRARFKALMTLLETKYPRVKQEHLRPGAMPFLVPHSYLVIAYTNDVPSTVTGIPFNNSLYVPRHGVSGADRVVVIVDNKEITLPDNGVLVSSRPDCVQFPLPSVCKQNRHMKFREPVRGEIAVLCYTQRADPSRAKQAIGIIGDFSFIGKDRKLRVCDFDSSSEDGSCGGWYISRSDGYCIGVHGIGASNPSVKPKFYPMTHDWIEQSKSSIQEIPKYAFKDDKKFFDAMHEVLNGRADMVSLNL